MNTGAGARAWRNPVIVLGVALAYAIVAWLSLRMSQPPSEASPLYAPAGLALACALRYGWRGLAGVALGALGVAGATLGLQHNADPALLAIAVAITCGATLQAGVGAALVRRFLPGALTLAEPRDVALFLLLGAPIASLISASVAALSLGLGGIVPRDALAASWWIWWIGDTFGVLIGAPIVLTLIGRPRADWAPRRLTLGLPLTLAAVLLTVAIVQVNRWNEERSHALFDREAAQASSMLAARLEQPLEALQVLRGAFAVSSAPAPQALRRTARSWLTDDAAMQAVNSSVWSLGYAQWITNAEAHDAPLQAEGGTAPLAMDTPAAGAASAAGTADKSALVVQQVEPAASHAPLRGFDLTTLAPLREAIERTLRTDGPAASAGFALAGGPANDAAVALVHALFGSEHRTMNERLADRDGLAFVILLPQIVLEQLLPSLPPSIELCLIDTDPLATRRVLAGRPDCMALGPDALLKVRNLDYGGRSWDIRASASHQALLAGGRDSALAFTLVGLLATAMLGALLLTVTGRTRRIENAVTARTAELEREIRERAHTESALRESETRFRNIFDNAPIGVIYTDLDGNVLQTNPRFCEMLGYSAEVLANMNLRDFVHPDEWALETELAQGLLRNGLPSASAHRRFLSASGETLWVQRSISLLRDAGGTPQCLVGVVEDITEHLLLQDAERAREVAEQSNRAKSEFLSRMSHELRTPLNAMLGFAQLLELDQRHPLDDAQRPWVAQIQGAGWHLLEMINDVLDLSRIEAGTMRLQPEPLALPPLLATTRAMIEGDAERRGIVVTQHVDDDATRVLGDATRVKQILTNLLSNAVKYNHDGGRIHVMARTRGDDQIEISVTDTGLGMTPEQVESLFQPFNRLGREHTVREGTGIGLVISRRLAELMGGSLRVRSSAGEGSSFILVLPRVAPSDTVPSALDAPYTTSSGYHRRIVHYVEDNETNVEVMRGILAQRRQVRLEVSMTGLDALATLRQRRPDLILLDMHLPDIDGLELLRHLKADPELADIPVVVVSADAMPAQVEAAIQAGALRYLTKPVSVAALLATVDELLERVATQFG
ncbi:MAG: PAS domain S-box protein [Burkholderiaceae bacterium]|jgi:PAS domain S-box-containing protein|nr:PAS domain S-box protein [Burkholderiaceae bacterium]